MAVALSAFAAGCGGNDPLNSLGDYPASSVELQFPIDPSTVSSVLPFGLNGSDGFDFVETVAVAASVLAPADGQITNIDAGNGTQITIYHNSHLTTRLSRLATASLRVGDYVHAGDIIGLVAANTGTVLRMSVFVDGSATASCPFSYLTTTARQQFESKFGSQYPCQQ